MKKSKAVISLFGMMMLCSCGSNPSTTVDTGKATEKADNQNGYFEQEDIEGNLYKGNFVNGLYDGYGVMEYTTGTVYEGTWTEGKWEGSCKITWDSGCVYVGEAHDGMMHGIGYMIWPMGDYYYGEWRNGNPNGAGTKYYMVDSTAEDVQHQYNIYTGDMKDNLKVGKGVMRYSFGAMYDGAWENDVRQGHGTVYWEPGTEFLKFEGAFKNDWIDGEGTMYYSDGRIITGTFKGVDLVSGNKDTESVKAFVKREKDSDLSGSVLMIGASYTAFWTNADADIGNGIKTVNFGIGGTTANFWKSSITLLDGLTSSPKQVFLRIGGNDFSAGRSLADTLADVKSIVNYLLERFPTSEIDYLPLVPAPCKMTDGRSEKQHGLNQAMKEDILGRDLARLKYYDAEDFVYLPKGQTGKYYDSVKDLYLDETLYQDDALHFNDKGYRLLGEAVRSCL